MARDTAHYIGGSGVNIDDERAQEESENGTATSRYVIEGILDECQETDTKCERLYQQSVKYFIFACLIVGSALALLYPLAKLSAPFVILMTWFIFTISLIIYLAYRIMIRQFEVSSIDFIGYIVYTVLAKVIGKVRLNKLLEKPLVPKKPRGIKRIGFATVFMMISALALICYTALQDPKVKKEYKQYRSEVKEQLIRPMKVH